MKKDFTNVNHNILKSSLIYFFFLGIFILTFSSCNNANSLDITQDINTLKNVVSQRNENIKWTGEVEPNRLTEKIHTSPYISKSLSLTPNVMIAFEGGMPREPVFPQIDNFGSLDISNLDYKIISNINSFFDQLKNNENCDSFMDSNSIFALSLFLYDLQQIDFSLNDLSWIIGKPFLMDDIFEIPIRLKNETNFLLVYLYIKDVESIVNTDSADLSKGSDYKIVNIEIINFNQKAIDGGNENGK